MKRALFFLLFVLSIVVSVDAQVHVKGYYRKDGTYVQPHWRSSPDGNPYNNWSYPGNVNPYTGKVAGGNSSTYLNNYYHRNGRVYSYQTASLFYAKFHDLKKNQSIRINGSSGEQVGLLQYHSGNHFMIVDHNKECVGWVKMRGPNSYTVMDSYGYRVRNKTGGGEIGLVIGLTAVVLVVAATR